MPTSSKLQALINGGVISNASQLTDELRTRIESLTDDEITHIIAAKAKLGNEHLEANKSYVVM